MTNDLDDLKSAMDAAIPAPDAARRHANLAYAQRKFDTFQGSTQQVRPTSENRATALWTGVTTMLNTLTSRGGLTATTALVACGFLFLTPIGQDLMRAPNPLEAASKRDLNAEIAAAPGSFLIPLGDEEVDFSLGQQNDSRIDNADDLIAPEAKGRAIEPTVLMAAPAPQRVIAQAGLSAPAEPELLATDMVIMESSNTESFANAAANPVKVTADEPVSTFSIDIDTASYSLVRSHLNRGFLPSADAVRVEELINYFPYDYAGPEAGEGPFRPTVSVMPTPWNADTQLVHIAIQGEKLVADERPPLNLVFLIDTSGSMAQPDKLPLLKQSFRLMLNKLRPNDQVAIVEYAGSAGEVLAPTAASDRTAILQAINTLGAGGSTNGQGGLEQAYAVAEDMAEDGDVSRVILATDGDFNVGLNDPNALKDFIADKRDSGTYLSVLGFGRGNLDDATMQALAQNGNGQAAYIDDLSEAQKVLVDQLSGALFPIANDVKIQVEFNPATVAEYRLIGYETRSLRREDFNNDAVDAGELGAGHSVTAIYEVTPVGSAAIMNDPLRYNTSNTPEGSAELGFLKLRFKAPGDDQSQLIETPITADLTTTSEVQFAAAIAGFGQLLRGSAYLGDWAYGDAIKLANAHRGDDAFGYRTQAVQLMRLAQSLSNE
ncbi:MAG: Ca-activated chloride channel family protein [Yoonia sp.]|jgi:Ca-activated chloride channel family protein